LKFEGYSLFSELPPYYPCQIGAHAIFKSEKSIFIIPCMLNSFKIGKTKSNKPWNRFFYAEVSPFSQLSGKDLKIFKFLPRKVLENEDILFI